VLIMARVGRSSSEFDEKRKIFVMLTHFLPDTLCAVG
jgi:hypothetical protein